jgi:preprotein translocase subunit YajC
MGIFDLDTTFVTLAQGGGAPPLESLPSGADTTGGGGGAPPPGPFGSSFVLLMLVMVVVMIIVSTIGPRRERKRREAMINSVKKHDRVQTVGGVIGAIVELKPDYVVLKVDESANTRITFARSAIQQVLSEGEGEEAPAIGK